MQLFLHYSPLYAHLLLNLIFLQLLQHVAERAVHLCDCLIKTSYYTPGVHRFWWQLTFLWAISALACLLRNFFICVYNIRANIRCFPILSAWLVLRGFWRVPTSGTVWLKDFNMRGAAAARKLFSWTSIIFCRSARARWILLKVDQVLAQHNKWVTMISAWVWV